MKIDELNNRHLIADEGKVLRRINDGRITGTEIYLGYTHHLGGEKLSKPLWELPEHYEEVSELDLITDNDFEAPALEEDIVLLSEEYVPTEDSTEFKQVTLADLLRQSLLSIEDLKKTVSDQQKQIDELKKK